MHKIFTFVSLVLFCLLLNSCDSTPKIAPLDDSSVILAFGDSLTHGNGAAAGQSYPEVLSRLIGLEVINSGVPGETTREGVKRLPEVLAEHQPTLVILCEGGNDFLRHHDQDRTRANLKQMIETIRASGAELILVGVPKLGFGLKVPIFYAELADEFAIPYEGEILAELLDDNDMKSDMIHPNTTGYRLMAEAIHDLIRKAQR